MAIEGTRRRSVGSRGLGLAVAGGTAVVSGFAVFVNGYGVRAWGDVGSATTYTTAKNLVAAAILITVGAAATRRRSPAGLRRPRGAAQWLGLALVAVFGGAIPFALFFEGLARVTSTEAAFIHKTLVIWVAVLAVVLLRERVTAAHVAAIGLLVGGQIALNGGITAMVLGPGELMLFAATLLWSLEVIVAKRLLRAVSPLTVGVARMAGGGGVLVMYGLATGALDSVASITASHVGWVVLTGGVLSMYVAGWFTALSLAPAIDVTAMLVGGALITAALRSGIQGVAVPSATGLGLVGCGVAVATFAALRSRHPRVPA